MRIILLLFLVLLSYSQLLNRSGVDSTIFVSHNIYLPNYPYTSVGEPWDVVATDINNDGNTDAIVVGRAQSAVSIHLNDGKGNFNKKVWINTCQRPVRVAVADLNLDNRKDLVFLCQHGNYLGVRFNEGGLRFSRLHTIKTGGFPTDLAVYDLNGDSYYDAVVVSNSQSRLYIHYWNKNLGNFGSGVAINTIMKPRSVFITDIDEDGKPDILVSGDNYQIAIHYYSGGRFSQMRVLKAPDAVWDLLATDLDKDGDKDIAFITYHKASICIYKNVGVKFEGPKCFKSGEYNFGVVAGDLDKDGDIDLATASSRDNVVNIHLNQGDLNFVYGTFKSGLYNTGIAIADVDNDGDLDILTCSANDNQLNVHRNIPINIKKEEKIKLYGYVKDTIKNKPLRGVVEVFVKSGGELMPIKSVMSNSSGYYEVMVPYGRTYKIQARMPGYNVFYVEKKIKRKSEISPAIQKQGIRVDLKTGKPESAFVFGKVIDKATGKPLPAKITIQDIRLKPVAEFTASTDGKYRRTLPLANGYRIIVEYKGYKKQFKTFDLTEKHYKVGLELNFALEYAKALNACAEGVVYDKKTNKPIANATIDIKDKYGRVVESVTTDANGKYKVCLEEGSYDVGVSKEGYFFLNDKITLRREHEKTPLKKNFYLEPLEKDKTFILRNIYFDYDKATLRPESKEELDRLVKILKENPTMVIEIGGHTDSDGSEEYNLRLSQARAEAVVNYLIKAGISPDRLRAKGYGESQPIAPNDTPENKQKNRRTEFKIISY